MACLAVRRPAPTHAPVARTLHRWAGFAAALPAVRCRLGTIFFSALWPWRRLRRCHCVRMAAAGRPVGDVIRLGPGAGDCELVAIEWSCAVVATLSRKRSPVSETSTKSPPAATHASPARRWHRQPRAALHSWSHMQRRLLCVAFALQRRRRSQPASPTLQPATTCPRAPFIQTATTPWPPPIRPGQISRKQHR